MFVTRGMPSASDARYGAPPEASSSPLRFSSSVRVTRSMACCPSPSAIICVKTRRCWSRKKSSGRRCSIARFSALLSSKIAPRTERSVSRLFGKGFSSVASTGMEVSFVVHLDLRSYIAEHLDGHGKFPDGLEGLAKLCLTFVNLEALRRESFHDIRRGN